MVKPIPTPSDLFGGRLPLDPSRAIGTYSAEPIAAGGSAIQRGAQELSGGAQALARGTERYAQGTEQLAQGAQRYAQGTQQYLQGNEQYARGMGQLGIGEQRLGQGIDQFVQDQQRFQFSTAHSQAMSQLVDLDTQFLNDTDYATRVQRYNEARDNIINTNAQNIASPFMRDRFVASMASSGAMQTYRQSEVAQKQYNSDSMAKAEEQAQYLIGKAISTNDPIIRGQAVDGMNSSAEALRWNKVLTPIQALLKKRLWMQQYARADAAARLSRGDMSVLDEIDRARPFSMDLPGPGYTPDQMDAIKGSANAARPDAIWGDPSDPTFPQQHLTSVTTPSGQSVTVNKVAAQAFEGFLADLENRGYKIGSVQGYNPRNIAGTDIRSQHAFGNAIDINPDQNPVTRGTTQTNLPSDISDLAGKWGLTWGGDWKTKKDPMHFEFTGAVPQQQPRGTQVAQSAQSDTDTFSAKEGQPPPSIYSVLTPLQREQIHQYAVSQANAQFIQQQRQLQFEQKQREQVSQGEQDKIIKDTYSPNPSISAQSIANNPDLTPKDKMTMLRFVAAATKPEAPAEVSHQATMSILDSMRKPDGDPNKITNLDPIYNAYINGSINRTDFSFLRNEFQARQTPDGDNLQKSKAAFFKGVEAQIDKSNPLMGNIDSSGKENMYIFNWDVNKKIDEYTKGGKNPYDLFDPSKPDFLGRPEVLSRYQKTLDQSLSDQVRKLTPPPSAGTALPTTPSIAPRKEGETPDQYFKRTGLQ